MNLELIQLIVDSPVGLGHSFNVGQFTPQLDQAKNPQIPYLPLVASGDPALGAVAWVSWFELQKPTSATLKVWNGSAWVAKPVKVWNGSAWVSKPLKYYNGGWN